MKKKFISFLMLFLLCFTIIPTMVFAKGEEDFMWKIPAMSEDVAEEVYNFFESARSCHGRYQILLDAMNKVKDQGGYTKEDITAIHKFYESQTEAVTTDSKAFLDLLYTNNIITKTQYDETLAALKQ